eukprot:gene1051-2059_t
MEAGRDLTTLLNQIKQLESSINEEKKRNKVLEDENDKLRRQQEEVDDEDTDQPEQSLSVLKLQEARHLQWRTTPSYWDPEEKEDRGTSVSKEKEKDEALDRALHYLAEREKELELVRTSSQANTDILKAELEGLKANQNVEKEKFKSICQELEKLKKGVAGSVPSGSREELVFLEQQLAIVKAEKERETAATAAAIREITALKEEKVKIVRRLNDSSKKIKDLLPLEDEVNELKKLLEESKKVITKLLDMQATGPRSHSDDVVFLEQQLALITAERDTERTKSQRLQSELEKTIRASAETNAKFISMMKEMEKKFDDDLNSMRDEFSQKTRQEIDAAKRVNAVLLDLSKETSNNLQHQLEEAERDKKATIATLQDTIKSLQNEVTTTRKDLESSNMKVITIQVEKEQEISALQETSTLLRQQLNTSEAQRNDSKNELKILEQALEQRMEDRRQVARLSEDLSDAKKLQHVHDQLQEQHVELQSRFESVTRQLKENALVLDESHDQSRSLREEIDILKEKHLATEIERDELKRKLEASEAAVGGTLNEQEQRLKAAITEQKRVEQHLTAATEERTRLLNRVDEITLKMNLLQDEISKKNQLLSEHTVELTQRKIEIENLKNMLNEYKIQSEKLEVTLDMEKKKVLQLEVDLGNSRDLNADLQRKNDFYTSESNKNDNNNETRINTLMFELENITNTLENECRRHAEVLKELSNIKLEKDNIENNSIVTIETITKDFLKSDEEKKLIENKLKDIITAKVELEVELEALTRENKSLTSTITEQDQSLQSLQLSLKDTESLLRQQSVDTANEFKVMLAQKEENLLLLQKEIESLKATVTAQVVSNVSDTDTDTDIAKPILPETQMQLQGMHEQLQWTMEALDIERARADVAEQAIQNGGVSPYVTSEANNISSDESVSNANTTTVTSTIASSNNSNKTFMENEMSIPMSTTHLLGRRVYGSEINESSVIKKIPLLELRLREALHLQYASAIRQRVSGLYWQQTERINAVVKSLEVLDVNGIELKMMMEEVEKQFFEERRMAQLLNAQFEKAWISIRGEILATVEPEMDAMDDIFSKLPISDLRSLTRIADAINEGMGYIPGETIVKQEFDENMLETGTGAWQLHTLRIEAHGLLGELTKLAQSLAARCANATAGEARLKSLTRCYETTFSELQGDYSLLVDMASVWVELDSVEALQECLLYITHLGGGMYSSDPNDTVDVPPFAILAVKNRLNPDFDARQYSAGYRDCFLNIRLTGSRYPNHVVELQLRLSQFTAPAKNEAEGHVMVSEGDFWPIRIFQASRTLKLFEMDIRSHIGPVTAETAKLIKDGQISSIQLDHFPFTSAGGALLIESINESTLGTITSISIQKTNITTTQFESLISSLKRHQRLKIIRAGGSADMVGHISNAPWKGFMEFKFLVELDLSFNAMMGGLPSFTSTYLRNLQKLVLHCNLLSGNLPVELGSMTNLKHLVLSRNKFSGPIPSSLGRLTALKDLQLWQNKLSGPIPSELGDLHNLVRLSLDNCCLSGSLPPSLGVIPKQISNLDKLKALTISDNQLTGDIPEEFGALIRLEALSLSGNQLTGEIPMTIRNMRALRTLELQNNQLTGIIPPSLAVLSLLDQLLLNSNQLCGEIPPTLGELTNLTILDLQNNNLEGRIPMQLCLLTKLHTLTLDKNKLIDTKRAQYFLQQRLPDCAVDVDYDDSSATKSRAPPSQPLE